MKPLRFCLLIFSLIFISNLGVFAQSAPKCTKEESDDFEAQFAQSPDDDYYYCMNRVCLLLSADQYDSVGYYLKRAMFMEGREGLGTPNQKWIELKSFLGADFSHIVKFDPNQDISVPVGGGISGNNNDSSQTVALEPSPSDSDEVGKAAPAPPESPKPDPTPNPEPVMPPTPDPVPAPIRRATLTLDNAMMTDLKEKAISKSSQFVSDVNTIGDRTASNDIIETTVDACLNLFINKAERSKVGVTSLNNPGVQNRYLVRQYLNRIRQLQYDKIQVLGTEYYMVKDFIKGPDSKYYGTVAFKQSFVGYKDGIPVYQDQTSKQIKVVIDKITQEKDGKTNIFWDAFLVEVTVDETKP